MDTCIDDICANLLTNCQTGYCKTSIESSDDDNDSFNNSGFVFYVQFLLYI